MCRKGPDTEIKGNNQGNNELLEPIMKVKQNMKSKCGQTGIYDGLLVPAVEEIRYFRLLRDGLRIKCKRLKEDGMRDCSSLGEVFLSCKIQAVSAVELVWKEGCYQREICNLIPMELVWKEGCYQREVCNLIPML